MLSVCRKVTEPIQIYTAAGRFSEIGSHFHRSFCENTGGYGNENFRTIIARPFLGPEGAPESSTNGWTLRFSNGAGTLYGICLERTEGPTIQRLYDRPTLASVLRQLIAQGQQRRL